MPDIETSSIPSVRARLQELAVAPGPPPAKKAPPPAEKPARKAPPPLPTRKTVPAAAPQRPRSSAASIRSVSSTGSDASSGRSLPPAWAGAHALPVQFDPKPTPTPTPKPKPPLPPRKSSNETSQPQPLVRARTAGLVPPLPARKSNEPQTARRLPPPAEQAPPPLPRRVVAPVPVALAQDRTSTPQPTRDLPPPIPAATRPPPVPHATRPAVAAASPVPSAPAPAAIGVCWHCRDFNEPDTHAAQAQFARAGWRHGVAMLGRELTAPFVSPTDKARALFVWLHLHVAYDTAGFFGGNIPPQGPDAVLRTGLSVCQGYAELFAALATAAGLEAAVVSGHGKGFGYTPGQTLPWPPTGHAWNAVRMDGGEWRLVDCCWGAGHVSREAGYTPRLATEWFVRDADEFGERHFPAEARWMLDAPRTWAEYCAGNRGRGEVVRPRVFTTFYDMGFCDRDGFLEPAEMRVRGGEATVWIRRAPCEHALPFAPGQRWLYFVNVGAEFGREHWTVLHDDGSGKGYCATVSCREGEKMTLYVVQTWEGKSAVGLKEHEFLGRVGRVGWSYCGLVDWGV